MALGPPARAGANALTPWTRNTLLRLLLDLQQEALETGRYPAGTSWDSRQDWHGYPLGGHPSLTVPYRCMTYERKIRQITALSRALDEVERLEALIASSVVVPVLPVDEEAEAAFDRKTCPPSTTTAGGVMGDDYRGVDLGAVSRSVLDQRQRMRELIQEVHQVRRTKPPPEDIPAVLEHIDASLLVMTHALARMDDTAQLCLFMLEKTQRMQAEGLRGCLKRLLRGSSPRSR